MNDLKPPRVWDKKEKKMYQVNGLLWIHGHLGSIQVRYGESLNPNKSILLMPTGLPDKNGKEIYELMEINNKYKVEYKPPRFVLTDISKGDILPLEEVIKNENGLTITKEYTEI